MSITFEQLVRGDFDAAVEPTIKLNEENKGRPLTDAEKADIRGMFEKLKERQRAITDGLEPKRIARGWKLFCAHHDSGSKELVFDDREKATDMLHFFECKIRDSDAHDRAIYEEYRDAAARFCNQFSNRHTIVTTADGKMQFYNNGVLALVGEPCQPAPEAPGPSAPPAPAAES